MPTPVSVTAAPEGFHTVTPQLTVKQGAAGCIEFLKPAFGAVELSRSAGPDGRLMHTEVRIGDSIVMLNDHFPEFGSPPIAEDSWPLTLHTYFPDADAICAQATSAGCQVMMPVGGPVLGRPLRRRHRPVRLSMGHRDTRRKLDVRRTATTASCGVQRPLTPHAIHATFGDKTETQHLAGRLLL